MKSYFKYLALVLLVCYSFSTQAAGPTYPGGPVDPRDALDQYGNIISNPNNPLPELEVQNTTYFKICEIRRFFCGKVKTVMIAAAIFIIGLLIIIGKITWTSVIVLISGMIIFASAEYITITLTTLPPSIGVIYSCYCLPT